ncbi:MAG: hypothetical protein IJQ62_10835 [Clostridia bacterium]|nr:hypothetical protein [Clostridia bacterium]
MNRKIIWGVPIAMVVVGLLIVLFSYAQPAYPAVVLSVGKKSYTPARNRGRSRSSAVYREELEVSYGDGQTATVLFSTTVPHYLPKAGDEVRITPWFSGMVTHPNRTLVSIGGTSAALGGFFIVTFLLTKWSLARDEKRKEREMLMKRGRGPRKSPEE